MIAAIATFGAAIVIIVLLFVLTVGSDRALMAEASIPEEQDLEEIYLEPELLVLDSPGEPDAMADEAPAPQTPGVPELAPEEQPLQRLPSEKEPERPVAPKEKLVAHPDKNDVVQTEPPKNPEDEVKKNRAPSGATFNMNTGSNTGKTSQFSGVGGEGVSARGNLKGRSLTFVGPSKRPGVSQKVTLTARVLVRADGTMSVERITGGTDNLRSQCRQWLANSRWTAKPGAADEYADIVITIPAN